MTSPSVPSRAERRARQARVDAQSMAFLIDELAAVRDDDPPVELAASQRLQAETARLLLPGVGAKSGMTPAQAALRALTPQQFRQLRERIHDGLILLARGTGHVAIWHRTVGASTVVRVRGGKRVLAEHVTGAADDVLLMHVSDLLRRVGLEDLAICNAPQSTRSAGEDPPPSGALFIRRGTAKRFCSDTCRARVATRRARSGGSR